MAKKEINVFSVSFLDLLSGALAAVIILFVIVPKMTNEEQEVVEVVNALDAQVSELDSLINLARNSVEDSIFQRIQAELDAMRDNLDEARERAASLEQELENTQQRNRRLEGQLVETEARIREMETALAEAQSRPSQEQIADLQNQLAEARAELESQREDAAQGGGGPGASMFGVNAKFAVVCDWQENIDVDLYLKHVASGRWIHYQNTSEDFGNYLGDVQSRDADDGKFEMIFQSENVVTGTYEVWYHVYKPGTARISGYAVLYPFTPRERKIKFENITLNHTPSKPLAGGGAKIGILRVSENTITLN